MFADTLPESIIKTLSIRVKELNGVNLGQGIPSFPTPPHIIAAAKRALDDRAIGVYPNFLGTIELREAIVQKLNREYKLQLTAANNVLVTVGAMEAVSSAILSLVETGDRVGIVTPDYCNHFPVVQIAKGKIVEIPMRESRRWELDLSAIEKEAKRGLRLLIITNPHNPTGAVYDKDEIATLVKLAETYGFWLLADETYSFLDYEKTFASLFEFWAQSDRLLVARSFSKEYAMTGWRVGYLIGQGKTIKAIAKTHDALVGCASKISQRAALVALTGTQKVVDEFVRVLARRRELVCKLLDEASEYMIYLKPQGAYYIFPKYKKQIGSLALMEEILQKARVAVVPGVAFSRAGEGHIRISFAVEDEVLKEGIDRLKKFFSKV